MEKLMFSEMNLSPELQKAVMEMGFSETTPIQAQSIPVILEGLDMIGQAQTGTGKTAAFGIPILEKIDPANRKPQAVILCPTRELAVQVAEEFKKLARYKRGIEILPIYGGQPIDRQIRALKYGVQVIIGTPGRVMDHLERRTLKLDSIKYVVLDEADEMLDMGFREDIEFILKTVPAERQTVLFSATMPRQILDLTSRFQRAPRLIKVVQQELTVAGIEQYYYEIKEQAKPEVLSRLIDVHNLKLALVFCNTKKKVDELVSTLQNKGYSSEGLHGDLRQTQRDSVMGKFRKGAIDILVATDVAARGIDVDNIEAVFNYDIPLDAEYYVHRIGRTGRAGKTGKAFTFVVGRDIYKIRDIQNYTKTRILARIVPSLVDVEATRTKMLLDRVKKVITEDDLSKYVQLVKNLGAEEISAVEVAAALFKLAAGEEAVVEKESLSAESFSNSGGPLGMVKLLINAGSQQKLMPKDVVGSIAARTGIPGKTIGAIRIFDKHTMVEIPQKYVTDVLVAMKDGMIKGNRITMEQASRN